MFFLDQILVNSHLELNLMCASKKHKCKSKNWRGPIKKYMQKAHLSFSYGQI